MNTIQIKLAPIDVMGHAMLSKDIEAVVRRDIGRYETARKIGMIVTIMTELDGEDACEEAFDLTNNPSRQDERERVYGRQRSVSVGDVIVVNDTAWICDRHGWKQL